MTGLTMDKSRNRQYSVHSRSIQLLPQKISIPYRLHRLVALISPIQHHLHAH